MKKFLFLMTLLFPVKAFAEDNSAYNEMYSNMKKLVILMLTPDHSNYIYHPTATIVTNALNFIQTLPSNPNFQTLSTDLNTFFYEIPLNYTSFSQNYDLSNITTLMNLITSLSSPDLETIDYTNLKEQVEAFQKFINSAEVPTIPDPKNNQFNLSLYDDLLVRLSEYFTQLGLQNLITPQQLADIFIQGVATSNPNPDEGNPPINNSCKKIVKGKITITEKCSDGTTVNFGKLKFKITLNQ